MELISRSYLGAFDPAATGLLHQVETKVEDATVVDNTTTTEAERRLSIQLFFVLALTCRGKSLQVVRRVPEGFGFQVWKQLCGVRASSSLTIPRFGAGIPVANEDQRSGAVGEQGQSLRGAVGRQRVVKHQVGSLAELLV